MSSTLKSVKILHLGRVVALQPASFGKLFHDLATVGVLTQTQATKENGWSREAVQVYHNLYWYSDDRGIETFCTYSGYTDAIKEKLAERGIAYEEEMRVFNELPAPDITKVASVQWRPFQTEVFAKLLTYDRGLINCPMAFGKSFIIRNLARVYPTSKIVVIVPQLSVARTLYSEMQDIPDVGFHGTGLHKDGRVVVCCAKSMELAPSDANLVLVDEAHSILTTSYIKMLNGFTRAKMFAFTATPTGRSDKADGFMEAVFGRQIAHVTYEDAVEVGNIVQLDVRMVRVTSGPDVAGISDKTRADRIGIWFNTHRNNKIIEAIRAVEDEVGPDAQILVMFDKVQHLYLVQQHLLHYQVVTGTVSADDIIRYKEAGIIRDNQPLCKPKDADRLREQFERNEIKRVMATMVWKQGVDFRDLQVLVRADGLASSILANQVPGRLSRLGKTITKGNGLLIDFYDRFSKPLENRSKKRIESYKANGWNITYV